MAASHYVPGQTLGSNLAQGFQAAERGYDTTARQAMGMLAARQNYAVESQHADLKKLQAALPLLSLQQQLTGSANTQKLLNGQVTPGTNIGSGGSIGNYTVPPELLPHYQAAAEKYGVPVDLLIAQHKQESNLNPGATGGAGEVGLGQILPATAKSPGFGMAGADPKALRDPAANIDFSARYLAARAKAAGADLRTPEGVTKALKAYNGGGDPNYVQNVTRYIPGAQKALAGGAPATPTPVGQNPNAKVQIPPPATTPAAPGQATMPPPEPPLLAGGAQTAGDVGAPTGTAIPTLPPAAAARSAADVTDIEAGMANAQANPLVRQPGAVVTAQAGGQQPALPPPPPIKAGDGFIVHPGTSYQEFFKREAVPPPTSEDFNPNLSQAQQKEFALLQQGIQQRIANRPNLRIEKQQEEATKIIEDRAALEAKIQATIQAKAQAAATNVTKWNEKQEETIRPRYEQMIKSYDAAAQANLTHSQAMQLKEKEGEISRLNTREGSFVESNKIIRDTLGKEAVAASGRVQNLEGLQALSDNVGDKNATLQSLATVKYGGKSLLDHLATFGVVPKGDAGPIQMLASGISGAITELRSGIQMGALSDRDLNFIESMGPSLNEDQGTRTAVIKYLQQAARAKMRFNTIYQEQMARPNMDSGAALEKTREIMDAKHPIVPQMTPEVAAICNDQSDDAKAARRKWAASHNVRPNSLIRQPDGSLMLLK